MWRVQRSSLVVGLVGLSLLLAVPLQAGTSFGDSSTGRKIALGVGSGAASLVYTPVKFLYAVGATITGGLVLAFTQGDSSETAGRVVHRGTRGDWWVHPDVFTGHRTLRFNGV